MSKLLGTQAVRVTVHHQRNHKGYSQSQSTHYQAVPLLRPNEVMRLPSNQVLVMRSSLCAVKARQLIWYNTASMKDLACD